MRSTWLTGNFSHCPPIEKLSEKQEGNTWHSFGALCLPTPPAWVYFFLTWCFSKDKKCLALRFRAKEEFSARSDWWQGEACFPLQVRGWGIIFGHLDILPLQRHGCWWHLEFVYTAAAVCPGKHGAERALLTLVCWYPPESELCWWGCSELIPSAYFQALCF